MDTLGYTDPTPGSSPRMRGTPVPVNTPLGVIGIIPAYAGNTFRWLNCQCLDRDHPRVCGEHNIRVFQLRFKPGSSPRMRGTRGGAGPWLAPLGIIPAYAGNTDSISDGRLRRGDHPRVCGEHCKETVSELHPTGSSPRMRGTH